MNEPLLHRNLRQNLLIDAVRDYAIFMLDVGGTVATWNPGAERIKQYRADEIIGQHFSCFYPEEDVRSGKCELALEQAAAAGRFEDEGWRVRKDGSRFWASVLLSAVRTEQGELVGFAKVTRDLTERKHAEEERFRLSQANEAIRMRDEFLSIASHELKTPLTSLQLQVSGLVRSMRRPESLDLDKLTSRLARVDEGLKRMGALINDLLDVSCAATGHLKLDLAQVDLDEIVGKAVARLEEDLLSAGCQVKVAVEHGLRGNWDRARLDQVLTNLLTNALKYGAGKPIEIRCRRCGDQAQLTVRDHGIGIDESERQRIFERFARAGSTEHYGGLGLGLWIVSQIVEAMGGSIDVDSEPGNGATFTVELPLVR